MFRRSDGQFAGRQQWRRSALVVGAALLAGASAVAQTSPDAEVESFLESNGLTSLLAEHLQDQLARTPPAQRAPIAERLAALYAELIEATDDPARRDEWESRARELLSVVPESAGASLRLDLERTRYSRAERLAEQSRLRLADRSELEEALRVFDTVAPVFASIAGAAHQDVLAIQRQEESGHEYDPELLARALRDARRRRSLGYYLAAWSNTYLAEMQDAPARAQEALPQFGWLLGAMINEAPSLDNVPDASMQFEHVARAAIGVAVCYAVLADGAKALDWLDLVENHEATPPSVRDQLPGRRLSVLMRLDRWSDVEQQVQSLRRGSGGSEQPLSPALARLIAVSALESRGANEDVRRRMARLAVADLVQRQEIAQLVDLGTRYGTAPIADGGFIGAHVRGLVAYESARDAHRAAADADAPVSDAAIVRSYRRAGELLAEAIRFEDARRFPEALAVTTLLLGMSEYFASGADLALAATAAQTLQAASERFQDEDRSADALWMAHRAARRAAGEDGASSLTNAIAQAFLDRFPSDERAGVLRVQLAAGGSLGTEDAVAILLDTPRESPAYEASQRHAARLLYDLYRQAPPAQRDWAALRYAGVAEPLLAMDRTRAVGGDARSAEFAIVRARRVLDALLSVRAPDAGRAMAALDALDAILATGLVEPPPPNEIAFRRLQIALALDDETEAARHAAAIRRSGDGRYTIFADRALFNHAVDRWRAMLSIESSAGARAEAAREVVGRGAQLLIDTDDGLINAETLPIQAAIAHAAYDLWTATGEREALDLAYRRHQLVLREQPFDQPALRRLAELAEAKEDVETALSCWRTLSSGLDPNTGAWFEARVRLLELLAEEEPERAREALRQHIALRPDVGPAPWGDRIRALAQRLNVALPSGDGSASP